MERDRRAVVKYVVGGLALAATVALAPFFVASGLMAPGWAVAVFIAVWVALVVLACVWIRQHPLRVVPVPLAAARPRVRRHERGRSVAGLDSLS